MAWTTTMVTILRNLIFDIDSSDYTYSDSQLQTLLAVAARYVEQEISFSTDYTVDVSTPDIDPDPTVTSTLDDAFTNFVVLKAACLTDEWTFRTKAKLAGVEAWAGQGVKLRVGDHTQAFKDLLEQGPCQMYESLKLDYKIGNVNVIKAILTPFTSNEFNPAYMMRSSRDF